MGPVPGPCGPTDGPDHHRGPGLYHFALTSGFWFGMRRRPLWLDVEGTGQRVIESEGLGVVPLQPRVARGARGPHLLHTEGRAGDPTWPSR